MSSTKNHAFFLLGAATALGITWIIRQRRQEISGLRAWRSTLVEQHGEQKARQLAEAIQQRYVVLCAGRTMPENPTLRQNLKESILPGLALYQVLLQEHGGDRQAALAEVDAAFRAQWLARGRLMAAPLKILPDPFQVFKQALKLQLKLFFPAEGWKSEFIEDSADRLAFRTIHCFCLDTLTADGAPELTASFCKTDDVMAEYFPPSIRFVRPHTLGRGDAMCDFQYCRVKQEGANHGRVYERGQNPY